jgi:xanthine dehydrogenase molybdopterin binding subunit/xanthine dehydrogenase small subunit
MAAAIQFILNGRSVRIDNCSPNTTLLEFLRRSGLTGAKEGCAEGDCGACSVVMVDCDAQGRPCYRAINSCLVPVCLMAGREIITVEGVAHSGFRTPILRPRATEGRPHSALEALHPVQRKMVERHGSQCGYCTPGFILSLFEGYYRDDIHRHDELDDQLSGNLCRCTGYRPIRDAAIEAFSFRSSRRKSDQNKSQSESEQTHVCCYEDIFTKRLKKAGARLDEVEYEFENEKFFRPTSLARLLRLFRRFPDGRLIAGATELGLDITKRFKRFPVLISVEAVPELKEIKSTETEWRIGASATLTQIEEVMAGEFPVLGDMLRVFGSRLIRNRATMGGNIVTASPIGDSAPVLLALEAKVVLASLAGERTLPIDRFFVAYRKTALRSGEILKTIIVPRGISKPGLTRQGTWFKVSKRREMDISTVAACFVVDLDKQNVVRSARLAYGGVAAMPARAKKTESALLGKVWNEKTMASVLPILRTEFAPISDVRGSAEYRSGLITGLLGKFFYSVGDEETSLKLGKRSQRLLTSSPAKSLPHESAHKHVTGEAVYTDDQLAGKKFLEVWPVCAPHARARILARDATAARQVPGIKAVLLAEDIPGVNDVGAVKHDEILLADKEVLFHGQIIALVVGESLEACRAAAAKVVVAYQPLSPVLTLKQAIGSGSFHNEPNFIRRGDCGRALKAAPLTLKDSFELGGQEHFYLETQAAWAERGEDGSMRVVSSTQHPSEVQSIVAHVLNVSANKVVVQSPRMGGGFGGKETQGAAPAALAALAARHTGQPVRVRWNRDQDMMLTGHRHPFLARFKVGFDRRGRLLAARVHLVSNGGWSQDLSEAITDRALFHLDNAYYIPAVEFRGQVAKTNLSSNTAFRGFGGPQGMLVMEEILDRIARRLGLAPETVRERNLYRGRGETNTTPYGQEIGDNRIRTIWRELKRTSQLAQRRKEIAKWNAKNPHRKRGLAMTPVKFGISFTLTFLNQAGALVLIYQDGSVQVNHGGTEMGQGIHTNVAAIAAQELGVKPEQVRVMPTSTDKVPNTSATAASSGTDMNGAAVKNACEILKERLAHVAADVSRLTSKKSQSRLTSLRPTTARQAPAATDMVFADGFVFHHEHPETKIPFAEVVKAAYLSRVSLSATGYYATPGIHWDRVAGRGKPFHYFACGAAVTEVEVDEFTGMHRVRRVDILHDAGDSINAGVNRGQVEGGFVQGLGWLTTEELKWDDQGRLLTHSPDTYKIPSVGDTPQIFNVALLGNAAQKDVICGSKAVGEPPLMLAISAREALREAVAAFGPTGREVPLPVPATAEAIWVAIRERRKSGGKPVLRH